MKKIIFSLTVLATLCGFASCGNDDDFTSSIFDTSLEVVDQNSTTAPFDQWIYENFVVPYNTQIDYKLVFPATSMEYQVTPADYKKSQLLTRFIKHLFFDVYNKYGEKDKNGKDVFMKKYGPRLFHYIGSPMFAPTTGTETLGYASGGVKITLVNVNDMTMWEPGYTYTDADIELLNKNQFHVMHHEFSHVMHQTKSYPVAFGQVTPGTYEPRGWQDRDSTLTHMLGYLTHYGSSANTEDFVEFLSCIITDTESRWMSTLIDACLNGGVQDGDKELLYALCDSLNLNIDKPGTFWNNFSIYKESAQNPDNNKFEDTGRLVTDYRRADATGHSEVALKFALENSFDSFRSFVSWVPVETSGDTKGLNAILKKIEIATKWYTENWGINIYDLRREVLHRQETINDFLNGVGEYEGNEPIVIYDYK